MSEDIKASDVFGTEGLSKFHCRKSLVLTVPEADIAVLCIQSHDRLTEENKRLWEMLSRLVSHDNCRKDVIHLMSEADSLLS